MPYYLPQGPPHEPLLVSEHSRVPVERCSWTVNLPLLPAFSLWPFFFFFFFYHLRTTTNLPLPLVGVVAPLLPCADWVRSSPKHLCGARPPPR